jgi:hypothetical protein
MDEQQMQMAAMEQMMSGGDMGGGMGGGMEDPFAQDAPAGYTMVYVPDAVLPAVMELVSQADSSASALGASDMSPQGAMMGGMPLV